MNDETQIMFTVSDVASIFSVSEETVRRWIRSGKLKTEIESKKDGHKISENALREFVSTEKPKYQKLLPFMGLSLLPIGALSPFLASMSNISLEEIVKLSVQNQINNILLNNSAEIQERLKTSLSGKEEKKIVEEQPKKEE